MILVAILCALLVLCLVVAVWAVVWPERQPPTPAPCCDLCDRPATVHLVAEFDDDTEQACTGGGSAMTADYCDTHATQVA